MRTRITKRPVPPRTCDCAGGLQSKPRTQQRVVEEDQLAEGLPPSPTTQLGFDLRGIRIHSEARSVPAPRTAVDGSGLGTLPAAVPAVPVAAAKKCGVKTLAVTHTGDTETADSGFHSFDMVATYDAGSTTKDPSLCHFRQDIKGYYKFGGVKQPLKSSGSGLAINETTYVDDGYHNGDDLDPSPTRFATNDNPGWHSGLSKTADIDYKLVFRAKVVNAAGTQLKSKSGYWIRIQGTHPRTFTKGGF